MTTMNFKQPQIEDDGDDEGVFELLNDIKQDINQLKKKPHQSFQDFMFYFPRTPMSYIRDLAFYVGQQEIRLQEMEERIEQQDETQFTQEDAAKFDVVVRFALGTAKEALASGQVPADKVEIFQAVARSAEECLLLLEKNTLEDDEDEEDGPEGDEPEEEETAEQN